MGRWQVPRLCPTLAWNCPGIPSDPRSAYLAQWPVLSTGVESKPVTSIPALPPWTRAVSLSTQRLSAFTGNGVGQRPAASLSSRLRESPPAPRSGAIPRPPSRPAPLPPLLGPPPSCLPLPPPPPSRQEPLRAADCLSRSSPDPRGLWVSHRSVCGPLHLCVSLCLPVYLCSLCVFFSGSLLSPSVSPSGGPRRRLAARGSR